MATIAQKLARAAGAAGALSRSAIEQTITVTAVTNTDFIIPVPKGARIIAIHTVTDTAFTAVTDAQASYGKTVGGAEYVAATTVKAVGIKKHTLVDAAAADYQGLPQDGINGRIAQSGGSTAVGSAKVYVEYAMPA